MPHDKIFPKNANAIQLDRARDQARAIAENQSEKENESEWVYPFSYHNSETLNNFGAFFQFRSVCARNM